MQGTDLFFAVKQICDCPNSEDPKVCLFLPVLMFKVGGSP